MEDRVSMTGSATRSAIRRTTRKAGMVGLAFWSFAASAGPVALSQFSFGEASQIRVALPYTLGTHKGAIQLKDVTLDLAKNQVSISIQSIKMDGKKLECHMRESLGLDYVQSDFPDSHVCDDNKLPAEGKNAVVFPSVTFGKVSVESKGDGYWVRGQVKVRDKTQDVSFGLKPGDGKQAKLQVGELKLSLKDFGIRVKPFLFVRVKDEFTLTFELDLKRRT